MGRKKDDGSSKPAESSTEASSAPSFEQSLTELQRIVCELESGNLSLDQSLAMYEAGVAQLRQCYTALERAEKRIRQLIRVDASGRAVMEDLIHKASFARGDSATDGGNADFLDQRTDDRNRGDASFDVESSTDYDVDSEASRGGEEGSGRSLF